MMVISFEQYEGLHQECDALYKENERLREENDLLREREANLRKRLVEALSPVGWGEKKNDHVIVTGRPTSDTGAA